MWIHFRQVILIQLLKSLGDSGTVNRSCLEEIALNNESSTVLGMFFVMYVFIVYNKLSYIGHDILLYF